MAVVILYDAVVAMVVDGEGGTVVATGASALPPFVVLHD
jgi:hypothetical protein